MAAAAALPGVNLLPDGDDGDVAPGQVGLDSHPLLEIAAEPVQEGDDDGIAGLDPGHQVPPARAVHGAAAGLVGEDQVPPDAVGVKLPELGLQVLGVVVGLADPSVAVGYRNHGNSVHKTGVFGHLRRTSLPTLARVSNNPVQQYGVFNNCVKPLVNGR